MSEGENIPQMRETIERLSKGKTDAEKEVSDLQGQLRVRDARDAFREEGYNPNHGDLFAAVNPEGDITAEAVVAFADKQGLPILEATQEGSENAGGSATGDDDGTTDLANMSGSGSRSGEGGAGGATSEVLTRAEWQELHRTDPAAAQAAITSGRVEISKDNPYVKGTGLAHGVNPYAAASATS